MTFTLTVQRTTWPTNMAAEDNSQHQQRLANNLTDYLDHSVDKDSHFTPSLLLLFIVLLVFGP